ncbi:hypothetical protein C1645_821853 [Glomus cerebriforme]|uniref:THH1/TOM1/TOM3 domain-containing protein n=1 Tax=Glomus cerebriforme TaxID=658196 RepID=A0A397T9I3_9GLOM|nr:hypothetical protein C1645_821853 [Glomus cerebriforme]
MVRLLNDYTRICKTEKEEFCSCDFRINIYGCPNSEFYVITGKILVAICIIETMMAIGSLIYLIKVKKQPFFLISTRERGWLRPRPLHSYHLLVVCFMFSEAIHLLALIYESYPTISVAEVGNIMKYVVGKAPAILYAVSIVYSTPNVKFNDNCELFYEKKGLNPRLVDMIGIILFFLAIITEVPLASLTVVWQIIYLAALAYFYYKLMIVIKYYIKILEERYGSSGTTDDNDDNQIEKVRKCTRNITLPVMAIVNGLMFQAIVYITFSFRPRTTTIYYFGWNLFYYCTEFVAFPLLGFSVESFLIFYTIKNLKSSADSCKSSAPSSFSEQKS